MRYYGSSRVPQKAISPGRTIIDGMATVLMNAGTLVAPYTRSLSTSFALIMHRTLQGSD